MTPRRLDFVRFRVGDSEVEVAFTLAQVIDEWSIEAEAARRLRELLR